MDIQVYRIKDLIKLLGVSKETIYFWIRKNQFPKPVKLGQRVSVWLKNDIEKWLNKRKKKFNETPHLLNCVRAIEKLIYSLKRHLPAITDLKELAGILRIIWIIYL